MSDSFFSCCVPRVRSDMGQNDRFEYLVLLNEDDLVSKWWRKSKWEKIKTVAGELHGHCHWAFHQDDRCGCCDRRFHVKGMLQKYVMYARLPKENMYVPMGEWDREYTKSQVNEILYIFRLLGVRELEITLQKNRAHVEGGGAEAGFKAYGIDASAGVTLDAGNSDRVRLKTKMSLKTVPLEASLAKEMAYLEKSSRQRVPMEIVEDNFIDKIKLDGKIHYLSSQHDWMHFIKERVKGRAQSIQYTYTYDSLMYNRLHVSTKLGELGVQCGTFSESCDEDSVEITAAF